LAEVVILSALATTNISGAALISSGVLAQPRALLGKPAVAPEEGLGKPEVAREDAFRSALAANIFELFFLWRRVSDRRKLVAGRCFGQL